MNTLLALTIEIPDWLFNGEFWSGFFTAVVLVIGFVLYQINTFIR